MYAIKKDEEVDDFIRVQILWIGHHQVILHQKWILDKIERIYEGSFERLIH